ncbi:FecR domain-containing protein [Sphingomonas oryzagri]
MSDPDAEWLRINRTAADWRAKLRGDDSEATREAFDAWLAESPAHRDANAAYQAVEAEAGLTSLPVPPLHAAPRGWQTAGGLALAASLLLACTLGLVLWHTSGMLHPSREYAAETTIRSYPLEGGADMILDAHSLVRTSFDGPHATYSLVDGRARFRVRTAEAEPFSVSLEPLRVHGSGATFDIDRAGKNIRVVSLAGRVDIDHPSSNGGVQSSIQLIPGQAFVSDAQGERIVTADKDEVRWTAAMLPLDGLTLGEVIAIGNREGGTQIILDDPTLASMALQGQLAAVDTPALAEQLAAAFDLACTRDRRGLVLSRRK